MAGLFTFSSQPAQNQWKELVQNYQHDYEKNKSKFSASSLSLMTLCRADEVMLNWFRTINTTMERKKHMSEALHSLSWHYAELQNMRLCRAAKYEIMQSCKMWDYAELQNMRLCRAAKYEIMQSCKIWDYAELQNMRLCRAAKYEIMQSCKIWDYAELQNVVKVMQTNGREISNTARDWPRQWTTTDPVQYNLTWPGSCHSWYILTMDFTPWCQRDIDSESGAA